MKDFKKYLMSKNIVSKKASLLFELGCSAYRYLISVLSIVPLKKSQSFDQVFGQIKNY